MERSVDSPKSWLGVGPLNRAIVEDLAELRSVGATLFVNRN